MVDSIVLLDGIQFFIKCYCRDSYMKESYTYLVDKNFLRVFHGWRDVLSHILSETELNRTRVSIVTETGDIPFKNLHF
jgi:hypothetical protein